MDMETFRMITQIAGDASGHPQIRDLVYRFFLFEQDERTEKSDGGLCPFEFLVQLSRIVQLRKHMGKDEFAKHCFEESLAFFEPEIEEHA